MTRWSSPRTPRRSPGPFACRRRPSPCDSPRRRRCRSARRRRCRCRWPRRLRPEAASVGALPTRLAATELPTVGAGSTPPTATLAAVTVPPSTVTDAAAPTTAYRDAGCESFAYAAPWFAPFRGDIDARDDLVGAEVVLHQPLDESGDATHTAIPPGPVMLMLAPSAVSTVGRSDAGSEWARLPPIVPRLRTAGSPIMPAASANTGQSLFTMSDEAMVACVVNDDIEIVPSLQGHSASELSDVADVDQHGRRGKPQLHQRDQAVPARQHLRVFVLGEQRYRFFYRAGSVVSRSVMRTWPTLRSVLD